MSDTTIISPPDPPLDETSNRPLDHFRATAVVSTDTMKVLITGAAGFIGQLVAETLLNDELYKVVLADVITPPIPKNVRYPQNAKRIQADLCTEVSKVVDKSLDAVFVFHGIMSSGAEANFELGMRVNVDATRSLLDALRLARPGIRVIYASSLAVYGLPYSGVVDESIRPTPQSSYGAEKLICETLVNDYNRRRWINGVVLRFPTITVRPGKPTAAASSFLSGMIREPFNGIECSIPIRDREFGSWVCSPKTLVANLMHALQMDVTQLTSHSPEVNIPGIYVTIQDMLDALAKVGGKEKLKLVKEVSDPPTEAILRGWVPRFDNTFAESLGFKADSSFETSVQDYSDSLK